MTIVSDKHAVLRLKEASAKSPSTDFLTVLKTSKQSSIDEITLSLADNKSNKTDLCAALDTNDPMRVPEQFRSNMNIQPREYDPPSYTYTTPTKKKKSSSANSTTWKTITGALIQQSINNIATMTKTLATLKSELANAVYSQGEQDRAREVIERVNKLSGSDSSDPGQEQNDLEAIWNKLTALLFLENAHALPQGKDVKWDDLHIEVPNPTMEALADHAQGPLLSASKHLGEDTRTFLKRLVEGRDKVSWVWSLYLAASQTEEEEKRLLRSIYPKLIESLTDNEKWMPQTATINARQSPESNIFFILKKLIEDTTSEEPSGVAFAALGGPISRNPQGVAIGEERVDTKKRKVTVRFTQKSEPPTTTSPIAS